jgi:hypothetical protein
MLIAMAGGSALFVASAGAISAASTTTYKAGGIHFQVAFPSKVTTTTLTKAELAKAFSGLPGVISGTAFTVGVNASGGLLSGSVPKPNAFEVEVIAFSSTSGSKALVQSFGSAPGSKKETFDGLTAYGAVGNAATLNTGTSVPDKNATQGDLAVLDGKSVLIAMTETTSAATTTSFFNSLKILS